MCPSLYQARSLIQDFHGLGLARVFWIPLRAERIRSGPLSSLIADPDSLSASELSIVRGYVDEFFTLPEANCLKHVLRDLKGYPLELIGHALPMSCRDTRGNVLKPLRVLPDPTWNGSCIIPHRGRLKLPFDVLALWQDETRQSKEDENDDRRSRGTHPDRRRDRKDHAQQA